MPGGVCGMLYIYWEPTLCSVHSSKHFYYTSDVILTLWGNYKYPHFTYEEMKTHIEENTLARLQLAGTGWGRGEKKFRNKIVSNSFL